MKLTLASILKDLLKEDVSTDEVLDAIRNKKYVRIRYDDGKDSDHGNPRGSRVIQPMAIGTTKKGHPVVRAFQVSGNSRKGAPNWKFFRLDRINKWEPYKKKTFGTLPDYSFGKYNKVGDKLMGSFIDNAKFVDDDTPLGNVRKNWDAIKNGPKLSTKNAQGPISAAQQRKQNVYTSQPNSEKWSQFAKNVSNDDAKGDDFWKMYDLASAEADMQNRGQQQNSGPIHNSSYDEDYYDIDDVDFDENNFEEKNINDASRSKQSGKG